jgi:hypothetical protein
MKKSTALKALTEGEAAKLKKQVAKKIKLNKPRYEIVAWLKADYGFTQKQGEEMCRRAAELIKGEYRKYIASIAETNVARIEQIIEDAYEAKQYKVALMGIQELNKIGGLYKDKIEISTEEPIVVSFG